MGKMTRKGGDWGRKGEGKLSFNRLFLRTRTQLRACAVPVFGCYFFDTRQRSNQENVPRRSLLDLPFHATLHSATREIKCALIMLCLNVSYHAWQAEKAKFFVISLGQTTNVERVGGGPRASGSYCLGRNGQSGTPVPTRKRRSRNNSFLFSPL